MNHTVALLGLALACAAVAARAQEAAPADREHYFALFGSSLTGPDDKRNPRLDGGTGADLRFGARPAAGGWGYEVRAFQESLEKENGDTGNRGGLGADALYRLPQFFFVTAYGLGGMALAYSDALPGRDWLAPVVNAGLGLESAALRLAGGRLRLRVEARYSYEDNRDEYATPYDYDRANYVETRAFAGLHYGFGPAPAGPKEPVDVVPPDDAAPPADDAAPPADDTAAPADAPPGY
jgi:hypothetical protein